MAFAEPVINPKDTRPTGAARAILQTVGVSLGDKLALGALIVAIVAVPAAAWVTRKYGTRRRKLLFLFDATSLVPPVSSEASTSLKVTYDNVPVNEPHLLTIRLENIGPSDVSSAHFDAGVPLRIELNCRLFGFLSNSHDEYTVTPIASLGTDNSVIGLKPLLLARRDAWTVEMVVSGVPAPKLISSLVDTDVVEKTAAEQMAVLANLMVRSMRFPGSSIAAEAGLAVGRFLKSRK